MGLEFVDELPTTKGVHGFWDGVADELKASPGKWAEVTRGDDREINRARTALKARGCELASRTLDGVRVAYARWPEP